MRLKDGKMKGKKRKGEEKKTFYIISTSRIRRLRILHLNFDRYNVGNLELKNVRE